MNYLIIFVILFFIINIILLINNIHNKKQIHSKNLIIDEENNNLQEKNKTLKAEYDKASQEYNNINNDVAKKSQEYKDYQKQLEDIQRNINLITESQIELSRKAFENYCEVLDNKYKEAESDYIKHEEALKSAYFDLQLQLIKETDEVKEELAKLEATRTAAIQAQLKEKEIEENSSFYCLQVTEPELRDIAILESIKPKLNNPRILAMLIWQTYWRTPMTSLCNNVVGKDPKTGIYKITNQLTKECYIGQAIDIADRFKQHAKHGLGIDTPAANKLYKAIQEFGIQNFSWEVLESCSKDLLDEKEKYYIKLYQSKEFGYNTLKGVG